MRAAARLVPRRYSDACLRSKIAGSEVGRPKDWPVLFDDFWPPGYLSNSSDVTAQHRDQFRGFAVVPETTARGLRGVPQTPARGFRGVPQTPAGCAGVPETPRIGEGTSSVSILHIVRFVSL